MIIGTRIISNVISRLTARRRATSSFLQYVEAGLGSTSRILWTSRHPVALPPLLSCCPSSVLDPIRCTHPGALIVRRGIRRTSAVFSGLRKACLATAVKRCSSIALQSSNIGRRSSRSPLRLLRQRRELKLPSDGSFIMFCTDCPLRTEMYKLAISSSVRANSRPWIF